MYVAQRIRDPIHNLITFRANEFEDVIWRVIQTNPFQRLRRVKQLGFSDLVYPGATHSRFAHSVGVFHTARQLMAIVHDKVGPENFSETKANTALAAALVHDVGHGPFSHAFEEVGRRLKLKLANHEIVSDFLIRDSEISEPLKSLSSGFHNDVASVIASKGARNVYDAVVSSQFDADRLDYMRRDRVMAGSGHGAIDYEWLISNLEIGSIKAGVDNEQAPDLHTFVIGPKGIFAAEAYVLGLFQLYPTIYFHKATRGLEKIFTELMVRVFELTMNGSQSKTGLPSNHPIIKFALDPTSTEAAVRLDDTVVYGALSLFCDSTDPLIADFAKRIQERKLLKCFDLREAVRRHIFAKIPKIESTAISEKIDLEKSISRITIKTAEKIRLLKQEKPQEILLEDAATRSPYKRLDESKGQLNQIVVRSSNNELVDLAEFSPVVRSIPDFELFRYYFSRESQINFDQFIEEEIKNGI